MRLQTRIWIFVYLTTTQRIHTQESLLFFIGWSRKPSWAVPTGLFSQPDIQKRGFTGDKFPSLSPCEVFPHFLVAKAPTFFVRRKSKAVQFSSSSPGLLQMFPTWIYDVSLKAAGQAECDLWTLSCYFIVPPGLGIETSDFTGRSHLSSYSPSRRMKVGLWGRLPACKPIWLWASYLTQFSPSVKWG